ncbi:MAG: hypothetical protein WC637_08325 [Victivallales bacterium]|jgi:hypothetical protein
MKKILVLVSIFLIGAVGAVASDSYAYKFNGGKVAKFKVIPADKAQVYRAMGFTVSADKLATEKAVGAEIFARYASISPQERILAQSKFAKLDIRRAMRSMQTAAQAYTQDTLETTLDAILASSPVIAKDWADATDINLDDPLVQQALKAGAIDVNKVKLKILELQK